MIKRTITKRLIDTHVPIKNRNVLFSRAIPTSSSVISPMDRFLVKSRKINSVFSNVVGAVCVYGPYGCGKTTWVREQLDPLEIYYDDPVEFMSRVQKDRWVLIDNFDALDQKMFAEWFKRDRTVYISNKPIDGTANYEFPNKVCLRERVGVADIHMDPKEYITKQLTTKCDPLEAIHKCGAEHGNGLGIVFENFPTVCSVEESFEILDSMSYAAVLDQKIYSGQWDYETLKYFNHFAFAKPLSIIGGRFKGTPVPATMWSKFLNICMKRKKLKEAGLDFESVALVREYAIKEQNPLGLSHSDLDSIKIGDLSNRLKAKTIQKLKKCAKTKSQS